MSLSLSTMFVANPNSTSFPLDIARISVVRLPEYVEVQRRRAPGGMDGPEAERMILSGAQRAVPGHGLRVPRRIDRVPMFIARGWGQEGVVVRKRGQVWGRGQRDCSVQQRCWAVVAGSSFDVELIAGTPSEKSPTKPASVQARFASRWTDRHLFGPRFFSRGCRRTRHRHADVVSRPIH